MNTRLFKLNERRTVLGYLTDSEKKEIAELELQQSNSVDDEAIAALQEAGEIEKTIEINTSSLESVIKDILTNEISPMQPVVRFNTDNGAFKIETGMWEADDNELTFDISMFAEFIADIDIDGLIEKYVEEQKDNFIKMILSQQEIESEMAAERERDEY